jgi:hypothetical protein
MAGALFLVVCGGYQASSQHRDGDGRWIRGTTARSGGTVSSLVPLVAPSLSPMLGCPIRRIVCFGLVAVAVSAGPVGTARWWTGDICWWWRGCAVSAAGTRRGGSRAGWPACSSWCRGCGVWSDQDPWRLAAVASAAAATVWGSCRRCCVALFATPPLTTLTIALDGAKTVRR